MVFAGEVHIVEEIQLLKNSEPIKNLLLSSEVSSQARGATAAQDVVRGEEEEEEERNHVCALSL